MYRTDAFLKLNQLKKGTVYFSKSGLLMLYLGINNQGNLVFYSLGICLFQFSSLNTADIAHQPYQFQALSMLCQQLCQSKINASCITIRRHMPLLIGVFEGFVMSEEDVKLWYAKNYVFNRNLPRIREETNPSKLYVSVKDLVPGHLYYTGNLRDGMYLYLGRNSSKEFCWYSVYDEATLRQNNLSEYCWNKVCTKSNKKIKPLSQAINDPGINDVYSSALSLIRDNWTANLQGLDLG